MDSDKDKLHIKIMGLNAIYNSMVEKLMIWNYIESQNIVLSSQFEIWNLKCSNSLRCSNGL